MPKSNKKEKVLYDFDYEEQESEKKRKKIEKAEKKKKSASKKQEKKGQAQSRKKYEDEIIIGVTKIPDKKEKVNNHPKKKKEIKPQKKKESPKNSIYNYDIDYANEKIEKRQNLGKKAKLVFKIIGVVAVFVGIVCFALLSPVFNVEDIEVIGNSKLSTEEIVSLSEIQSNVNIFKVLNVKTENKIKQNAYVENVTVSKKLPNTIKITVEERKPSFLLKFGNGYVYLNNQGYMLEISSKKIDLPVISGIQTPEEKYATGNRLEEEDLKKLGTAIKIMDVATSNNINNLITSIDISDISNYKVYFETEKKVAYLGDCSNLETRMLYISAIIENEKNIEGEIFVNMNLNSENAFFRENV